VITFLLALLGVLAASVVVLATLFVLFGSKH
jgi:hypothetical protein